MLFKCLLVTNGSRWGRAVGWDIVILGWRMAPGQEGWEWLVRRQEADHEVRWTMLWQKQGKSPVFRL